MSEQTTAIEVIGEDEAAGGAPEPGDHRRVVTIDNKDNGDTLRLRVPDSETVGAVIDTMYSEFRLTRETDDRLTCQHGGTDVYQYSALTIAEYLRAGHCPDLRWDFVGGTGARDVTAVPAPADPEIAAAVFADHVARVSGGAQARERGWVFTWLDAMHVVVAVTGTRPDGQRDGYYLKLGAEYYDRYPPTTSFVCPPRSGCRKRARPGRVDGGTRREPVAPGRPAAAVVRHPLRVRQLRRRRRPAAGVLLDDLRVLHHRPRTHRRAAMAAGTPYPGRDPQPRP